MNSKKITVLYQRLSVDDDKDKESNSIENQRALLEEYAKANGFVPYINIADDGYTGANFNRPGWQKLIDDIGAGNVSTLIIKDLTRFGRDYLRMGLYREWFREKGVRLIAVNDSLDSDKGEDDLTPFKEMMAEFYARDGSRKVKSAIQAKGRTGKPTANIPPYGYVKDPNDKHKWLVDPEAAAIVKRIFEMTIDGMGPRVIAGVLHSEKVERPSYYLAQRGLGRYKNTCDNEHKYSWNYSTVVQILKKQEYAGYTVNFKMEKPSFKSNKCVFRPKEDWLIFENKHEAIVTQEMWELVQKLRETVRRNNSMGEANSLTGLLYCADCGSKMHNHRQRTGATQRRGDRTYCSKPQNTYSCSTHKNSYSRFNAKCTPHIISAKSVRTLILDLLRETSGYVREHEQEFIEKVREMSKVRERDTAKLHKKQINKSERRIAELERIYRSLYEDKALGKISEERFDEMFGGYEQEREELRAKTAKLQSELDAFNADSMNAEKFIKLSKRFANFEELTPAMLNEFVDKIIVHQCVWSDGANPETGRGMGSKRQKVDVYLKYIGCFDVPDLRTQEEIEADMKKQERIERERKYKREYARKRNKRLAAEEKAQSA